MPDPTVPIWHQGYITTSGPSDDVPEMITTTTNLVKDVFKQSRDWASDALATAQIAIDDLRQAKGPDALPDPPTAPDLSEGTDSSVSFPALDKGPNFGDLTSDAPGQYNAPAITIPDVTGELVPYVPVITGLSIPDAPAFVPVAMPVAPAVNTDFTIPDAPQKDYGLSPILYALDLPVYVPPTLPSFTDAAPEFNVEPPSPFVSWKEPVYQSDVRDAVKSVLATMLAGGTGLPANVELGIWERARERETRDALSKIDQAQAQWASRGHSAPPGQLNGQMLGLLDDAARRMSEQSREVMIKQADLEQTNRNFAVTQGISYENVFVGLFIQVVERNFQLAKFGVETQMQIFSAQVTAFNVRQAVFAQKTERVRLQLEIAFANLKEFQALVEVEKVKGELNVSLVQAFTAKVTAFNSEVEAYKALVQSVAVKSDLEKNKVELYKAEIDGAVGLVNGQRAQFEAYSARVAAEASKATLEEANAHAYTARVQGIAAKSEILIKRADAQIQSSRIDMEWAVADMNRLSQITTQQLALAQLKATTYDAATRRAVAQYEADKSLKQMQLQVIIERSRVAVANYQAQVETWKARATQVLSTYQINAESTRALGTIASNLAAGAMAATHASAGVSGAASAGQSKSISEAKSESFAQSVSDSNSYNTNQNFNHET